MIGDRRSEEMSGAEWSETMIVLLPDLSSTVRIVGASAYVHVDSTLRRKLGNKAVKLTYVGHCQNSSAYLLLHVETWHLIKSGRPEFVEHFDECGKRIADRDMADTFMIDTALQVSVRPTPFRQSFRDLSGFGIVAHMAYYDNTENNRMVSYNYENDHQTNLFGWIYEHTWQMTHKVVSWRVQSISQSLHHTWVESHLAVPSIGTTRYLPLCTPLLRHPTWIDPKLW